MKNQFSSFKEFYPFYLSEHADPVCRRLHFIGTGLLLVPIMLAFFYNGWFLLMIPIIGYGFAWAGHYFFEKNKPATFKHPLYSLLGDFVMFYHILTFQIKDRLKKAIELYPVDK